MTSLNSGQTGPKALSKALVRLASLEGVGKGKGGGGAPAAADHVFNLMSSAARLLVSIVSWLC